MPQSTPDLAPSLESVVGKGCTAEVLVWLLRAYLMRVALSTGGDGECQESEDACTSTPRGGVRA